MEFNHGARHLEAGRTGVFTEEVTSSLTINAFFSFNPAIQHLSNTFTTIISKGKQQPDHKEVLFGAPHHLSSASAFLQSFYYGKADAIPGGVPVVNACYALRRRS